MVVPRSAGGLFHFHTHARYTFTQTLWWCGLFSKHFSHWLPPLASRTHPGAPALARPFTHRVPAAHATSLLSCPQPSTSLTGCRRSPRARIQEDLGLPRSPRTQFSVEREDEEPLLLRRAPFQPISRDSLGLCRTAVQLMRRAAQAHLLPHPRPFQHPRLRLSSLAWPGRRMILAACRRRIRSLPPRPPCCRGLAALLAPR